MNINIAELRIDKFSNSKGVILTRMVHVPTGLTVSYEGPFKPRIADSLKTELEVLMLGG